MGRELTEKQKLFVQEYLKDLNATQAAIRAGYSEANADKIGSELLGKTRVRAAVDAALEKRANRTQITQDMVLKELASIGFSRVNAYLDIEEGGEVRFKPMDEITDEQVAAVASLEEDEQIFEGKDGQSMLVKRKRKIKLWDKVKALDKLGQHLGMWEKNQLNKGDDGPPERVGIGGFNPDFI